MEASNESIPSAFPSGLVAVFIGGTSGIGEYTLKQFARQVPQSRVYFVGRSEEAGDRIAKECKAWNPDGEFTFIKADISLLRVVDDVCRNIKEREKYINLLFMSQGTLAQHTGIALFPPPPMPPSSDGLPTRQLNPRDAETSENLPTAFSLMHYSRARFALNLLPLLAAAPRLRRILSVLAGTKEGPVSTTDIQARNLSFIKSRGHAASLHTLTLERLKQMYPSVSLIHVFPGLVKSGITREMGWTGWAGVMRVALAVMMPIITMSEGECGARQVFLATSARFPPGKAEEGNGVKGVEEVGVARGTDGREGSGVYSVLQDGASANEKVEALLRGMREDGTSEEVWGELMEVFGRITGKEVV